MDAATVAILREAVLLGVLVSLPPLGAVWVAGVIAGIVHGAARVEDAAVSVVPRMAAAVGALVLAGPWIVERVLRFTSLVLAAMGPPGAR